LLKKQPKESYKSMLRFAGFDPENEVSMFFRNIRWRLPNHTGLPSTVLCFMSLLMSLLPASGEFVEFPSPRVILRFFPHP
jgi:hypothetical protein